MASLSARKPTTPQDWYAVDCTLQRIAARAKGKAMHKIVCPDTAYHHLRASDNVWFVGGYLVYFEVGTPWYSDRQILSELLIVRVGPGGTLRGVALFLREQARAAGAALVAVGTTFSRSDRALARLYQAEGFTPEAITLTMEP